MNASPKIDGDETIYGCTSKILDDQRLVVDISSDLVVISQWWEKLARYNQCLENQTSFMTSLPDRPRTTASHDEQMFSRVSTMLRGNIGPQTHTSPKSETRKDIGKMIGSLCRSNKHLTLHGILYVYKRRIESKMDYCCHFWAGAVLSSLFSLHRV